MRKVFKRLSGAILVPFFRCYLKRVRYSRYDNLMIKVSPTVFHPGLFGSTRFLLEYIKQLDVYNRSVLDLGCGSGAIGLFCASRGAIVTALDLNAMAIQDTKENANVNELSVDVLKSDLFDKLGEVTFDYIFVNPPFYPRDVFNDQDLAWYCGKDFQYFEKLFTDLPKHINETSKVFMVLTKACDLERIGNIAGYHSFTLTLMREKPVLFEEKLLIYRIEKSF